MTIQFKNNAYGTITSTHGSGDPSPLTITLTAGHGARFPTASSSTGEFFIAMLVKTPANQIEFIKVYNRSTDTLSATRAWGGFVAKAWAPGDRIVHINDATTLREVADLFAVRQTVAGAGSADAITASVVSGNIVLQNAMEFTVAASAANATTIPTLAVTFDASAFGGTATVTGAKALVKGNNRTLDVGDIPAANYPIKVKYISAWDKYLMLNPANGVSAVPAGTAVPSFSLSDTVDPGHLWADGQAVSRTAFVDLLNKISMTQVGTTVAASAVVTALTSTAKMFPQMRLTGTGIDTGSFIKTIDSGTQITLNKVATVNGSPSLRFYPHGAGDESTTFNVPNLNGRGLVGFGAASVLERFYTADVSTGTDEITVGANEAKWITGMAVVFNIIAGSITASPALTNGNTYFVIRVSSTKIKAASTLANAQNGTAIDITAVGASSEFTITHTGLARKIGEVLGQEVHAQTPAELGPHNHPGSTLASHDFASVGTNNNALEANTAANNSIPLTLASQGGGVTMNILGPLIGVRWMVKT